MAMSVVADRIPVLGEHDVVPLVVEQAVSHWAPLDPRELDDVSRWRLAGVHAALVAVPVGEREYASVLRVACEDWTLVFAHDADVRRLSVSVSVGGRMLERVALQFVDLPYPAWPARWSDSWEAVLAAFSNACGLSHVATASVFYRAGEWPEMSLDGLLGQAEAVSEALRALRGPDQRTVGALAGWWLRRLGRGLLRLDLSLHYHRL